jgi:hypothetical protein
MSRLNGTLLLSSAACLVALGSATVACESREQMMREAEDRANYWGYPAHHVARDLVYADYRRRQLKLDLYRPPEGTGPSVPGIIVVRGGAWRFRQLLYETTW